MMTKPVLPKDYPFTADEIKRLRFVRLLVEGGRYSDDDAAAPVTATAAIRLAGGAL